jgi:hypothetical protein
MIEIWKLASSITFEEAIRIATGEDLNPQAYIDEVMMDEDALLARNKQRVKDLEAIPKNTAPVNLNAHITLAHGKETIATNEKSFEDMCETFGKYVNAMKA